MLMKFKKVSISIVYGFGFDLFLGAVDIYMLYLLLNLLRTGPLSPTLTAPLPPVELTLQEQQELGYMPLRDDFERVSRQKRAGLKLLGSWGIDLQHINCWVQDCSISSVFALEILQSSSEPSI